MIEETTKYSCRSCGSENIIRNGHNKCGSAQYKCKACGACRVLTPKIKYTPEEKSVILHSYRERISLRGLQRVFGVWRGTVLRWLKTWVERLPSLQETLLPAQDSDVLELDELVSFVAEKFFKRWLWLAMCRRTRQIVAYAIGDRSETTAQKLWQAIPEAYRTCPVYTDEYNVYPLIIPPQQHRPAPKVIHQTNHQERWNNTLRQGLGRYTRKTLSFSKQDVYHSLVTHWFIVHYNLRRRSSLTM
jgi:insertion element IS1 protein InsB